MSVLGREDFEDMVLAIARVSGPNKLEAELAQQVNAVVANCREALEDKKRSVFLGGDVSSALLQLLPDLQQETFKGRTLFVSRVLERLAESRAPQQHSTMTQAAPPSSTDLNTSNPEASTKRCSRPQSRNMSNTLKGRQTGRIQKAQQKPVEQQRRSARLKKLQQRDKLG